MGLKYTSTDSQQVISGLKQHIEASNNLLKSVQSGVDKVTQALGTDELSGKAYDAAKTLFDDVIRPTNKQLEKNIADLNGDLQKYMTANAQVAFEGVLDEDKINAQLQNQRAYLSTLKNTMREEARNKNESLLHMSIADMVTPGMISDVNETIRKLEKQKQKLIDFDSETRGLFKHSVSDLQSTMKQVTTLSKGQFKIDVNSPYHSRQNISSISSDNIRSYVSDVGKEINANNIGQEALNTFFNQTSISVLDDGKNIGRVWGAKLQPRSANGQFMKDTNVVRSWFSGNLKSMSESVSSLIGKTSKIGGGALVAIGAVSDFIDYDNKYNNKGRAVSYSLSVTSGTVVGGSVGAALGVGMVSALGLSAGMAFAAPLIGAVAIGAAVSVGIKKAYENFAPFKNSIDAVGDILSEGTTKIGNVALSVGRQLSTFNKSLGFGK